MDYSQRTNAVVFDDYRNVGSFIQQERYHGAQVFEKIAWLRKGKFDHFYPLDAIANVKSKGKNEMTLLFLRFTGRET